MITEKQYLEIQDKIRQICSKYGMEERNTDFEIQLHLKSSVANIFGEVIRLFSLDMNRHDCVVFFNELQKSAQGYLKTDYEYIYQNVNELIPKKYPHHQNQIPLYMFLTDKKELVYEEIEYIIKGAIKQLKKLEIDILKNRIEKDFN